MKPLNRIDFFLIINASYCNPNGDPLNGNRPRQTIDGLGVISDVCLKHKIRERINESGVNILIKPGISTASTVSKHTDLKKCLRVRLKQKKSLGKYAAGNGTMFALSGKCFRSNHQLVEAVPQV